MSDNVPMQTPLNQNETVQIPEQVPVNEQVQVDEQPKQIPIAETQQNQGLSYKFVCSMDYQVWVEYVQNLHNIVLNIKAPLYPNHQDLMRLFSILDNIRGLLSVFKIVIDNQVSLLEGVYKNAKRELYEGKNEAERTAAMLKRCKEYTISAEIMSRAFMRKEETVIDLVDTVEKIRAKKTMLDNIHFLIADKMQSLTMQSSILKDSSETMRYNKQI